MCHSGFGSAREPFWFGWLKPLPFWVGMFRGCGFGSAFRYINVTCYVVDDAEKASQSAYKRRGMTLPSPRKVNFDTVRLDEAEKVVYHSHEIIIIIISNIIIIIIIIIITIVIII